MNKLEFQWKVNEYLCGFIKFADQKASAIIAFFGIVVPVFSGIVFSSDLCPLKKFIIGGIGVLGLSVPILLLLTVFMPRTPRCESGLIFWENILGRKKGTPKNKTTEYEDSEYSKAIKEVDGARMFEELSKQNYNLSTVLHGKYLWTKWMVLIGSIYLIYYVVAIIYIFAL